jgi:hypothetical protein
MQRELDEPIFPPPPSPCSCKVPPSSFDIIRQGYSSSNGYSLASDDNHNDNDNNGSQLEWAMVAIRMTRS